jgi:hypothetical protein
MVCPTANLFYFIYFYFKNFFYFFIFLLLGLTRIFLTTKQRSSEMSLQTPVSRAETVVISTYQETSVNSSDTNASSAKLSCKSFRFLNQAAIFFMVAALKYISFIIMISAL